MDLHPQCRGLMHLFFGVVVDDIQIPALGGEKPCIDMMDAAQFIIDDLSVIGLEIANGDKRMALASGRPREARGGRRSLAWCKGPFPQSTWKKAVRNLGVDFSLRSRSTICQQKRLKDARTRANKL